MLFSKNLFAALFVVAAVGVNGSPAELEKRQQVTCGRFNTPPRDDDPSIYLQLCSGKRTYCCRWVYAGGLCRDVPGDLDTDETTYVDLHGDKSCTAFA